MVWNPDKVTRSLDKQEQAEGGIPVETFSLNPSAQNPGRLEWGHGELSKIPEGVARGFTIDRRPFSLYCRVEEGLGSSALFLCGSRKGRRRTLSRHEKLLAEAEEAVVVTLPTPPDDPYSQRLIAAYAQQLSQQPDRPVALVGLHIGSNELFSSDKRDISRGRYGRVGEKTANWLTSLFDNKNHPKVSLIGSELGGRALAAATPYIIGSDLDISRLVLARPDMSASPSILPTLGSLKEDREWRRLVESGYDPALTAAHQKVDHLIGKMSKSDFAALSASSLDKLQHDIATAMFGHPNELWISTAATSQTSNWRAVRQVVGEAIQGVLPKNRPEKVQFSVVKEVPAAALRLPGLRAYLDSLRGE